MIRILWWLAIQYEPELLEYNFNLPDEKGYRLIQYASKRLQDDKEVMMEAVKRNPYSLEYASTRLQNDHDMLVMAVRKVIFLKK